MLSRIFGTLSFFCLLVWGYICVRFITGIEQSGDFIQGVLPIGHWQLAVIAFILAAIFGVLSAFFHEYTIIKVVQE